jgi:hypothetical protein
MLSDKPPGFPRQRHKASFKTGRYQRAGASRRATWVVLEPETTLKLWVRLKLRKHTQLT